MNALRTPDERFANLPGYNFEPHYVDVGGLRSVHSQTVEKAGRRALRDIKTMKDDAAAVEKESEAIKARYTKLFRV